MGRTAISQVSLRQGMFSFITVTCFIYAFFFPSLPLHSRRFRFYLTLFEISKKTLTDQSEFYSYEDAVVRLQFKLKTLIALKIKRETNVVMSGSPSRQHHSEIRDSRLNFDSEVIAIDQLMQRDIMNASPAMFAWGI